VRKPARPLSDSFSTRGPDEAQLGFAFEQAWLALNRVRPTLVVTELANLSVK